MVAVHHLNNTRSQRVLWMLEELGLDYNVVRYQRDAETMLAPESGARVVRVDLNAPDAAREAQQVMAQVDRALQA